MGNISLSTVEYNEKNKMGELEALLFMQGEAITCRKIEEMLHLDDGQGKQLAQLLDKQLKDNHSGLRLMFFDQRVQLTTRSEFHHVLREFLDDEMSQDLTPASLETLSIILYFGPIARSKIEYLRGVNSIFTLRNLLMRGLIEKGHDSPRHAAYVYQASPATWRFIGISRKEDLPQFEKFSALVDNLDKTDYE